MSKSRNRIWEYAGIATQALRPRRISLAHYPPARQTAVQKHCILLHGWGASGEYMHEWMRALRNTDAGQQFHFWIPTYDTSWRSFPQSGRAIKVLLERARSADFTRTIILGHSMGGLVAREMVRAGFPFQHLVALCSPHHGAAPWIPLLWRRTRTLSGDSALLHHLNSEAGDLPCRARYHFWGVVYADTCGTHQHDGVVEISSALGDDISGEIDRKTFRINFQKSLRGMNISAPHVCALSPKYIPQAAAALIDLM